MESTYQQHQEWDAWNRLGFIPGPEETESEWKERAAFCQTLEKELIQKIGADLPFEVGDYASQAILKEGTSLTADLYGISPDWVPVFFNNYQLAPWHGGCAWIFQIDEQTPTAAFLQLRARFRSQDTYLYLYRRQELMAHELAHVGRMMYQEPQFEEILAYRTSSSFWRRWLGPIVQSSKESLFFIFVLGTVIMADLALLAFNSHSSYLLSLGLKLAPLILFLLAVIRLAKKQRLFSRCLKRLQEIYRGSPAAQHLIYRLLDKEICLFARSSSSFIKHYATEQAIHSFRWRFLLNSYPFPDSH